MNTLFWIEFGIFLAMQAVAQTAMKMGTDGGAPMRSRRWWFGFVAANAVGAPSMLFVKQFNLAMPDAPNVVLVLVGSGVFIATQLVFMLCFRSRLSALQWAGVALLALGAVLAAA